MRHETLAKTWAIYKGQKGTAGQVEKIMKRMDEETLARMLRERGYKVD